MDTYYVTFGQKYRREPHPGLVGENGHPEAVMKIIAPDLEVARDLAWAVTRNQKGQAEYADIRDNFNPAYYPRGVVLTLTWEPHNG